MNKQTAESSATKQRKIADIIIGLIFFAGFIVLAFIPETCFGANLFNLLKSLFKNIGNIKLFGHFEFSLLFIAVFYVISLVFTVFSFFTRKKAARAFNYLKAILGVIAFVNVIASLYSASGTFSTGIIKQVLGTNSITFSLALSVLYLLVLNFMQFKKSGFVKLLLFVIALGFIALYNFAFIKTFKLEDFWNVKFNLGSGIKNVIATYAYLALGFGILANLLCAFICLFVKKTGVMDYIRSIALFIIAAVCFVMLIIVTEFTNIEDYLGTICSLALSAIQCFAVIIIGSVKKRKAKKQAEAAAQANNFVFDENNQMAIKGYENTQTATSEPVTEPTSSALDDAAQISIDDIAENSIENETATTETANETVEEIHGEPVEEKPFSFEQAQYDGQYNREYAEYAEREQTRRSEQEHAQQTQTQQTYQQAPYVSGQGYARQYAQNYGMPYYNASTAVLPDAFINGLTPEEKDEFDKLFISRIYGENKRLPMYLVGGDNREFFAKVFVFIGRYRNIISDGLLEKIYKQSNLLK